MNIGGTVVKLSAYGCPVNAELSEWQSQEIDPESTLLTPTFY